MDKRHLLQVMLESYVKPVPYYDDGGVQLQFKLVRLLDDMLEAGIKAPCVDGDKCQFLLSTYIEPSFNYWDEDFEEKYGDAFREFMESRRK